MPFRSTFDCLWCGRPHTVRAPGDLEGWAQLCPDCLGRAGDNAFLRARLRAAIDERGRGPAVGKGSTDRPPGGGSGLDDPEGRRPHAASAAAALDLDDELRRYYAARAGEYDDWYLRRGRYSHGPIHDLAWQADLEAATDWLTRQPIGGDIVELAAGTGWWSPILAGKGELWMFDAVPEPLERARDRLLAHRLRAHLHLRDAWEAPDRTVDTLFAGFWLSHVPTERLAGFLAIARRWLREGGSFLFIDSRRDADSGAVDQPSPPGEGLSRRRLADGREFIIPKVFHEPEELHAALLAAGFSAADVSKTARFFLLGRAVA